MLTWVDSSHTKLFLLKNGSCEHDTLHKQLNTFCQCNRHSVIQCALLCQHLGTQLVCKTSMNVNYYYIASYYYYIELSLNILLALQYLNVHRNKTAGEGSMDNWKKCSEVL